MACLFFICFCELDYTLSKQLLATVPKDMPVFSPSDNFELSGRLKNNVNFYSIKDLNGKAWLILKTK